MAGKCSLLTERHWETNLLILADLFENYAKSLEKQPSNNPFQIKFRPYPIMDIIFHRVRLHFESDYLGCLSNEEVTPIQSLRQEGSKRRCRFIDRIKISRSRIEPCTSDPLSIHLETNNLLNNKVRITTKKLDLRKSMALFKAILGSKNELYNDIKTKVDQLIHSPADSNFTKLSKTQQASIIDTLMEKIRDGIMNRLQECKDLNVDLRKFPLIRTDTNFCFCQQYKTEGSIKCDSCNPKDNWFHFSCVGLDSNTSKDETKGKWKCPACCLSAYYSISALEEVDE